MTKTLFVESAVAAALFNLVIRPEFDNPSGKWGKQSALLQDWSGVVAVFDPDHLPGRTFPAQKTNWNVNDSNWVNPTANYTKIATVAREANGGTEVPKKKLIGILEDLKKTFALESPIVELPSAPIESDLGEVVEPKTVDPIVDDHTDEPIASAA